MRIETRAGAETDLEAALKTFQDQTGIWAWLYTEHGEQGLAIVLKAMADDHSPVTREEAEQHARKLKALGLTQAADAILKLTATNTGRT